MRCLLRTFGLGILIGAALTSLPVQVCRGQVRVNEILADPTNDWDGDGTSNFRGDEWVEIVNAGAVAVSLDGHYLTDASNVFRYGFSGTLAPGAVLLVNGTQSVGWETSNAASIVGLSLNNGGDTVRIFRVSGADTVLVDEYTYAAHEVLDDRSTGRTPDGADTWFVYDGLNLYTGTTPPLGTGCPPTPGLANGCPVPVTPSTWGDVKRLYDPASGESHDNAPPPAVPTDPDRDPDPLLSCGRDVLETARGMARWN